MYKGIMIDLSSFEEELVLCFVQQFKRFYKNVKKFKLLLAGSVWAIHNHSSYKKTIFFIKHRATK